MWVMGRSCGERTAEQVEAMDQGEVVPETASGEASASATNKSRSNADPGQGQVPDQVAGHENTTAAIVNGLAVLLDHPAELAALRANPSAMSVAIDELLRYDSPIQKLSRVATADFDLEGRRIRRGQRLWHCRAVHGRSGARQSCIAGLGRAGARPAMDPLAPTSQS